MAIIWFISSTQLKICLFMVRILFSASSLYWIYVETWCRLWLRLKDIEKVLYEGFSDFALFIKIWSYLMFQKIYHLSMQKDWSDISMSIGFLFLYFLLSNSITKNMQIYWPSNLISFTQSLGSVSPLLEYLTHLFSRKYLSEHSIISAMNSTIFKI